MESFSWTPWRNFFGRSDMKGYSEVSEERGNHDQAIG